MNPDETAVETADTTKRDQERQQIIVHMAFATTVVQTWPAWKHQTLRGIEVSVSRTIMKQDLAQKAVETTESP